MKKKIQNIIHKIKSSINVCVCMYVCVCIYIEQMPNSLQKKEDAYIIGFMTKWICLPLRFKNILYHRPICYNSQVTHHLILSRVFLLMKFLGRLFTNTLFTNIISLKFSLVSGQKSMHLIQLGSKAFFLNQVGSLKFPFVFSVII